MKRNKIKELLKDNKKKIITGTIVVAAIAGISTGAIVYNNHVHQPKIISVQKTVAGDKVETLQNTDGTTEVRTTDANGNVDTVKKDESGKAVEEVKTDSTGKVVSDVKGSNLKIADTKSLVAVNDNTTKGNTSKKTTPTSPANNTTKTPTSTPTNKNDNTDNTTKKPTPTPSTSNDNTTKKPTPTPATNNDSKPSNGGDKTPTNTGSSTNNTNTDQVKSVPFGGASLPSAYPEVKKYNSVTVDGNFTKFLDQSLEYACADMGKRGPEVMNFWNGKVVGNKYKVTKAYITGTDWTTDCYDGSIPAEIKDAQRLAPNVSPLHYDCYVCQYNKKYDEWDLCRLTVNFERI